MPKVSAFTGGAWRASPGCAAERQRRWSRASKGCGQFERSGRFGRTDDFVWLVRSAYVFGPTPVGEAIERVEALAAAAGDSILLEAGAKSTLGQALCDER